MDELHNLSVFATCVHPAPALKLQQLWDQGVRLVALMDDRAWETLSQLGAPEGLALVEEVAENMGRLNNVNAYFTVSHTCFLCVAIDRQVYLLKVLNQLVGGPP